MIPAYSELYAKNAREVVGEIFNFAINGLKLAPNFAAKIFVDSKISKLIEKGNPAILVGKTKEEVAFICMKEYIEDLEIEETLKLKSNTKESWAGSVLAAFQHRSGKTFKEITDQISFRQILDLYDEYSLMDMHTVLDAIKENLLDIYKPTKLKQLRTNRGFSQAELAQKAGVALRMIQLYEQKVNDIDNAQAGTLCKLANALNCEIKELLEKDY